MMPTAKGNLQQRGCNLINSPDLQAGVTKKA